MANNDPTALIDQLYAGLPWGTAGGGRGSGFADRDYWLEHPSEILNGRLAADLAGTGTDQPTGTPGTGPWSSSGRNAQMPVSPTPQQGNPSNPQTPTIDLTQSPYQQFYGPASARTTVPPGTDNMPNGAIFNPDGTVSAPNGNDQILGSYSGALRDEVMRQLQGQ